MVVAGKKIMKAKKAYTAATVIRDIQRGRPEKALKSLEKLMKSSPENPVLWNLKGVALGMTGEHEKSLACYEKVLENDPAPAVYWNNKGLALQNLGRFSEAEQM